MTPKKIASFALGPLGGALLGLAIIPVITWSYTPEDIGRISMLQIATNLFVLILSFGLDQSYVREYHESKNKHALLKMSVTPGIILTFILLLTLLINEEFLSKYVIGIGNIGYSYLIATCFISAFLSRFLSLILRMQERGLAFSMSQILPKIIFLSCVVLFLTIFNDVEFSHLIISHSISIITVTLVYAWNTKNDWMVATKEKIDSQKFKLMLNYGFPLILSSSAFWMLTAMDKILLKELSSFEELGIYSVATNFAAVAIILQSIFSTVWAPIVYKWATNNTNIEKINQVTNNLLSAISIIFPLTGIFSWAIVYILSNEYSNVKHILVACMAYPLFYTLSETTVVGLSINRKSNLIMLASIIAAITNFLCNYWLVPLFGAAGAAVSTAISFWILLVCRTEFSVKIWMPIPRLKIYLTTFYFLILSCNFAMFGEYFYAEFLIIWLGTLIVSLYLNRKNIIHLILYIKNNF